MKVSAFDTSQVLATVCLIKDGKLHSAQSGSVSVAHSEALLPLVDTLLNQSLWKLKDLDGLAVGTGPGSFTGIRIGCSTAKAFSQVLKIPALGFSSLKSLYFSGVTDEKSKGRSVVGMSNAYQSQVFVGWHDANGSWQESAESVHTWLQRVKDLREKSFYFCGTGTKIYESEIPKSIGTVSDSILYTNADGILRTIQESIDTQGEKNAFADCMQLHANYLRPSQAEAKLIGYIETNRGN